MIYEKKKQDEIISLFMTIFHENEVKKEELLPIIKSSENIEKLLKFILMNNNNLFENNQKNIRVVSLLTFLFQSNLNLIPLFMSKKYDNKISLLDCLTDIYLNEKIIDHDKLKIEALIQLINKNYTIQKNSLEYIYQNISKYFRNEGNKRLTEQLLLKYLNLLNIYYTDKSKSKLIKQDPESNKINVCKEIKKYIYFNGMNSGMQIIINKKSCNSNSDYPTLEGGCTFSFWISMDKNIVENYFRILPKNIFIYFIKIIIGGRQILLKLKDIEHLIVSVDENESNKINISKFFKYNDWNNIIFIMEPKSKDKKITFKVYINNNCTNVTIKLDKILNIEDKIENIILLENFLGKLTSVIFFSFKIENTLIAYFSLISGFSKNKYLFKFLQSLDKNYYSNTLKCKNKNTKNQLKYFEISLKEQNIKNLISCFCPFTYDKHKNIIDDIFGNFIAQLNINDGVNNYKNKNKNIKELGGINNLLPIIELMISTLNNNINYNLVDKNILTEKTFKEFLSLIQIILTKHKMNIIDANITNFFACLSIFLEKIPGHLYTPNILNTIIEISNVVMNENFDEKEKKLFNLDNNYKYNYLNTILVNEKIIYKFSLENQVHLWTGFYNICVNNPNLVKDLFNISKISLLLRFYDEKRYEEYCCSKHALFFNEDNVFKIMKPEMNEKVSKLFEIIQLFINFSEQNQENLNLFRLLSLDLSPCLQKKIINVYISYFSNNIISEESKLITLDNLLKNNYFDLSEYVLSISLLDVRIEIMKLFKIFMEKYLTNLEKYLKINSINFSTILNFISNNLIPNKLFVELEKNKNNSNNLNKINDVDEKNNIFTGNNNLNILPLTNFLNKKEYNEYLNIFWNLLASWITLELKPEMKKNSNLPKLDTIISNTKKNVDDINLKKNKTIKIHYYALNFCIDFTTKSSSFFIHEFLLKLVSIMKNDKIDRYVFFGSRRFFPWLIDTIFFYYNIENKKKIDDQMYINEIQTQSLNLLGLLFSLRLNDSEIIQKIDYILEYSYYYKDKNLDNNLDEIIRITRIILEKIIKSNELYIDIVTRFCFEFMFLYKNNKKLFAVKNAGLHFKKNTEIQDEFLEITKSDDNDENNDNINYISMSSWENIDGVDLGKKNSNSINDINSIQTTSQTDINNSLNNSNLTSINNVSNLNIIPEYFLDGVNYNKIEKNKKNNNLDKIWNDFILYDSIISYYQKTLWGTELLCTKVKINYNPNKFSSLLIKELIKSYGDHKDNKNILNNDIIKLLKLNKLTNKEKNKTEQKNILNILNINLILLCLSLEISNNMEEKKTLKHKLEEFLLYCILVSINIPSTDIYFSYIRKIIIDILGYACIFLKKYYPQIYDEVLDYLFSPIFELIIYKRRKTVFNSSKKSNYQHSSVYKLFDYSIIRNDKNNNNIRGGRKTMSANKLPSNINNENEAQSKRNLSIDKKESNKLQQKLIDLTLKGDPNIFIKGVIDSTINYYKSERAQNAQNDILSFYSYNEDNNKNKIKNNENDDDRLEEKLFEEKMRIRKSIKKLIPFFGDEIKVYSNTSALTEIRIRCFYKKNKKKLFSWNGFWSDKNLFFVHPEYLKLKIKNHFTKNMTKIILTPIYDVEYYLPDFSKFDNKKLFNDGDYKYKIHLNVDEILNITNQSNNNNKNNNLIERSKQINENNLILIKKNKWGFNYLQNQYKYFYEDLWNIYVKYYERKINFDKIILKNKETFDILIQTKLLNSGEIQSENLYFCCIVKPTHHIKGYLSTECDSIKFTHCSEDDDTQNILENDPSYDKDMKSCFGSTFKCHKKDKEKVCTEIYYKDISYMFQKNYFYQETGVEIYTFTNKSYFLNFKNKSELSKFINNILAHSNFVKIKCTNYKTKKQIGYMKDTLSTDYYKDKNKDKKLHSYKVTTKMEEWQNWKISTLEYLMWLNIYSGRSFNDLTQYPILPWLITNYENDEIKNNDYRNLSIPMGMLDVSEKAEMRKENFIDFYNTLKTDLKENFPDFNYQDFLKKNEDYLEYYNNKKNDNNIEYNQIPYFFGSHYSNPTYVSHYLTRLFPFCSLSIEIHGNKFDDVNRIFISLVRTFETASTLKDDVRELIPEFYTLPEMFLNKNNLNLAQNKLDAEGNKITIHDVELPPWSNNISYNFITEMRKILEKSDLKINKWIDLIFGNLQRGEKAEENHNIFMAQTYENMININDIINEDNRNALMRLVEVGVTPSQIFKNETKMRPDFNILNKNKGKFLYESRELTCVEIISNNYNKLNNIIYKNKNINKGYREIIYPKIVKILPMAQNEIKIICNNNLSYNIKKTKNKNNNSKNLIEETNIQELENISSKYSPSYQISNLNTTPIIIYNNNKYMIKAGFWDNHIEFNSLYCSDNSEKLISYTIFIEEGPIIVMEMSSDEKMLLCGTKNGYLIYFSINKSILEYKKSIYTHNDEITSISINNILNMFATSSLDGYVMIRVLPSFNLVRIIKINFSLNYNFSEDEFFYANNVFLSSSPLPCITLYISSKRIFRSYTINGEFIGDIQETDDSKNITCFKMFSSYNFFDYLIYGTDDGYIKIRSFPDMNLINSIKPGECHEVISIEISQDKKYCYTWINGNKIYIIKDNSKDEYNIKDNGEIIEDEKV